MSAIDILIIDDQREVRRMIKAALESLSPEIRVQDIPSAEEALYLLSRQTYRLMIADIRLAGMSGIELVEKVRQIQPGLPIIIITGLTDEKIIQEVEQAPVQAWFRKPIEMDTFLPRVEQLLGEIGVSIPAGTIHTPSPETPSPLPPIPPTGTIFPLFESTPSTVHPLQTWQDSCSLECLLELDAQGKVLAQAGNLPLGWEIDTMVEFFRIAAHSLYQTQEKYRSQPLPHSFFYRTGDYLAGVLSLIETSLLFITRIPVSSDFPYAIQSYGLEVAQKLWQRAMEYDTTLQAQSPASDGISPSAEEIIPDTRLESLLGNEDLSVRLPDNPDRFWEEAEASTEYSKGAIENTLGYDEAQRMGLAPHDSDKA